MKTLYLNPVVAACGNSMYFNFRKFVSLILVTFLSLVCFSQSQTGLDNRNKSKKLQFKNPYLLSGVAGADLATYRFDRVESDLDAVVKITQRSSPLVRLVDIDMSSTGHDEAFQPQVTFGNSNNIVEAPAEWWMEFEISFFDKNSNRPARVEQFDVTGIDIDGNNHKIREFISFYGLTSYTFESKTLLQFSNVYENINGVSTLVGKRFDGPTVNFINIDTSGTAVMVTSHYEDVNKFRIRVGAVASGYSGLADRMYSLYFRSFNYNSAVEAPLPVNLLSFAALLNQDRVLLNWQSADEVMMSHYDIERSADGRNFKQVALVFCDESTARTKTYSFSDKLINPGERVIYYRLRMVDLDGKFTYSPIRLVNRDVNGNQLSIGTYPNPVHSQIQITVPSAWATKPVSYELFSANGQLMKRISSVYAGQTETIDLSDLKAGIYTIKAVSGNEHAVTRIVKVN